MTTAIQLIIPNTVEPLLSGLQGVVQVFSDGCIIDVGHTEQEN